MRSIPVTIDCEGNTLVGILEVPASQFRRCVLFIVGGPQYRVGSHRQFVLLARQLANHGIASMRFDHRGIGDSNGKTDFEHLESDIDAAIDAIFSRLPQCEEIFLWGLCDAASAAMMYVKNRPAIAGLILVNPWARSDESLAQSRLKFYYFRRLFEGSFWRKLLGGDMQPGQVARDFFGSVRDAWIGGRQGGKARAQVQEETTVSFRQRMIEGLNGFSGPTLLILSGEDLTAREFENMADRDKRWRTCLESKSITIRRLADANHTFSKRVWRDQIATWMDDWFPS